MLREGFRVSPVDEFELLVADWVAAQQAANTRLAYRADLDVFRTWWNRHRRRPPLTATVRDVERFEQACIDEGASVATVARRIAALSSFFTFAVARGAREASPVAGTRRGPPTTSSTGDLQLTEIAALVRASTSLGDRAALLVGLLLFDGLKLAEVLAANADDIRFAGTRTSIVVRRRGDERRIPLDARTAVAARSYLAGRAAGPLMLGESPTRPSGRLTRFGADYLLKQISADAGVHPAVSANTLRRSYVTSAFAAGVSLESIRDRLGHAHVRTTRRHLTEQP